MRFTVKNILSTILCSMLILSAAMAWNTEFALASSAPEYIDIGLKYGSTGTTQYEVYFDNGVILGKGDSRGFTEMQSFEGITSVVISLESGTVKAVGRTSSGESIWMNESFADANCIMPYNYRDGNSTVSLGDSRYRGGILFNTTSGSLNIINHINIEEYLYGVINGELNKSNPKEALKAQAVAARSYATYKLGTHNSYGFDLCAGTHCQVYKGFNDEYPETIAAVDETAGDTINYQGKTVAAFFFKNSAGYTQAAEDVWMNPEGYLKAVKDEHSPSYPWTQSYTLAELSNKLSAAGQNIGSVTTVSITKRNQSGAVETLQFTGTNGTATLEKDKIRSVLGSTSIKSTMFSLGEAYTGKTGSQEDFTPYALSNNQNQASEMQETVYVIDGQGVITKCETESMYVHNGNTTKALSDAGNVTSEISYEIESVSSETVTFTGMGYGHGIGMPQDSAVEMAKKGFTYDEILKYYYTDITVE